MSDPIVFDSTTPRIGLPLLFAGQAQKETFVNEALARLDGLTGLAVEAEQNAPPAAPADGQAWIVGSAPTGSWAGFAGRIALRQAGQWLFIAPWNGLHFLDLASGQNVRRHGGAWVRATAPDEATGGSTVDSQARSAISALITALRQAGIFAT